MLAQEPRQEMQERVLAMVLKDCLLAARANAEESLSDGHARAMATVSLGVTAVGCVI